MAKGTDDEDAAIIKALDILLTPDGRGRMRKATALSELCCTINPNKLREFIAKQIELKRLS